MATFTILNYVKAQLYQGEGDSLKEVVEKAVKEGAYLSGANLRGADLRGAYLRGAYLSGTNLRGAYLRGAYLSGADLRGADLRDADLRGAYLRGAYLRGADLRGAYLSGAYLSGADLSDADLSSFKQDLIAEILRLPDELEALRQALMDGKVDGSTYSGECACLAGTLARLKGTEQGEAIACNGFVFSVDSSSPRERWFMMIKPGDTPSTNQVSKLAVEWIDEAIAIRDHIRGGAKDNNA